MSKRPYVLKNSAPDAAGSGSTDAPSVLESASPGGVNATVPELNRRKMRYTQDEFVVDPHVAVFDEHDGAEEGLDIVFTEEVLQQIIENTNLKIKDTGDMSPIFEGHLTDGPEWDEGDLLGFATNFHLGTIGNVNPRACIFADLMWLKDKYQQAKEYPRRSIELWLGDDMVIDNLGALKRRPQR